jgi:uncharacterized protein YpuA (DUF1002 family)
MTDEIYERWEEIKEAAVERIIEGEEDLDEIVGDVFSNYSLGFLNLTDEQKVNRLVVLEKTMVALLEAV